MFICLSFPGLPQVLIFEMFGHPSFATIALNVMDKLLEIQYLILFVRSNIIVVNFLFALPFPHLSFPFYIAGVGYNL
jgi:hypothetical protein